jgi:2-polyprenyl-3-methyl-5-hydroxy-6-metoxy-1,4-benzoquinol methylase
MTLDSERWARLRYEDFKALASEESLSLHERIGFPDAYREGYEDVILDDMRAKATNLDREGGAIVDVGCGCGVLTNSLVQFCDRMRHSVTLVDAEEVLRRLPEGPNIHKVPGRFPVEAARALEDRKGSVDVVIAYSVLQYVVQDSDPFDFIDRALELLAPGGQVLIGDIPNLSMRRRFFSSAAGRAFHRAFTGSESDPEVQFNALVPGAIDDSVIVALLLRARSAGFDAFVVPQGPLLPMANRREDLLIRRP